METFIKKYKLNPTDRTLSTVLESSITLLQRQINSPQFSGIVKLRTRRNFDLLQHIIQGLDLPKIVFKMDSNTIICSIKEGKSILANCLEVLDHYRIALNDIHMEKLKVWRHMEHELFVETRAVYQTCTADSKSAQIQDMINQIREISLVPLPKLEKAVQQKITPTPVFIWARYGMQFVVKVQDRALRFNFTPEQKFHYVPLCGTIETIQTAHVQKVLIVENLDTAFALNFIEGSHNYDLLLCAGGMGNSGTSFLSYLESFRQSPTLNSARWIYFGDFDVSGFKIYEALKQGASQRLRQTLEFLLLPQADYRRYLIYFGKPFTKDTSGKKRQFYKQKIQDPSIDPRLHYVFGQNLELERELEQNALIYCFDHEKNQLVIDF